MAKKARKRKPEAVIILPDSEELTAAKLSAKELGKIIEGILGPKGNPIGVRRVVVKGGPVLGRKPVSATLWTKSIWTRDC